MKKFLFIVSFFLVFYFTACNFNNPFLEAETEKSPTPITQYLHVMDKFSVNLPNAYNYAYRDIIMSKDGENLYILQNGVGLIKMDRNIITGELSFVGICDISHLTSYFWSLSITPDEKYIYASYSSNIAWISLDTFTFSANKTFNGSKLIFTDDSRTAYTIRSSRIYQYSINRLTGEPVYQTQYDDPGSMSFIAISPDNKHLYSVNPGFGLDRIDWYNIDETTDNLTFLSSLSATDNTYINYGNCFNFTKNGDYAIIVDTGNQNNIFVFSRNPNGDLYCINTLYSNYENGYFTFCPENNYLITRNGTTLNWYELILPSGELEFKSTCEIDYMYSALIISPDGNDFYAIDGETFYWYKFIYTPKVK